MAHRDTGIDIVGPAPWGSHFCQFYTTGDDLLEILVPYFAAGLRDHEYCMWITCEPLTREAARAAIVARCPGAEAALAAGQLEIIAHDEWYVIDGAFESQRVLAGWVSRLERALARGYAGLRLTGNTFWLESRDWRSFAEYEAAINAVIGQSRMLALCTSSLQRCGAREIIDVIRNHEFALLKEGDHWEIVESQQRRSVTESLAGSEKRFRALFEHSLNALAVHEIVTDQAGEPIDYVFVKVNRAFEQQTGLSADRVVGRRVTEVLPGIEHTAFIRTYGRVALTGEPIHFEEYSPQLDRYYQISAFSPAPRQFAATFLDITARKAAELALREQASALAEANRLKDEFLTTLSHELRTPLNAVLGWAQILRDEALDPATVRQGLDTIERNARAQKTLIEEILDVSRMITGKLRLELRPVDLAGVVRDAVEAIRPAAGGRRVTLRMELDASPTVVGDAERLHQVLWNLLSNAVKFTPPGGGVEVRLGRVDSKAQLIVRDNGVGIDAQFLPHIFERFTQADGSTTRQHAGLGLGLAIVRHLVELHGGEVQAASAGQGAGAAFTVTLPIRAVYHDAAEPPEVVTGAAAPAPRVRLDGVRALVVDDEPDDRELVTMVLSRAGAEVRAAASAAEALVQVGEFRPGILIADIGMPGEDGYELIRKVRMRGEEEARLPAIALTAYGRPEDRSRALAAGFSLHLIKPVAPADLAAAVRSLSREVQGV